MAEGTLEPTPKRLERARREGDLGGSGGPARGLVVLAFVLVLPSIAGVLAETSRTALLATLGAIAGSDPPLDAPAATRAAAWTVLRVAGPLMGLVGGLATLGTLLETRFGWAPSSLVGGGTKTGFSPSLATFARAVLAGFVASVVAVGVLVASARAVASIGFAFADATMAPRLARTPTLALRVFAALSIAGAFVTTFAAASERRARLRMTHREVEDERRAGEGDPEVKAARRRVAETVFSEVPLSGLPRATSAVVAGPGRAVLVAWHADTEEAPRVLRRLLGPESGRLAEEAAAASIHVLHDDALATSLARVEVGAFVPEDLYDSVAGVYASIPVV